MNTQNVKKTSIIAALVIVAVALIVSLSQTQITAAQSAPKGNNVYVFGEGVNPQATFAFKDATVTYDFQLFDMTSNLFGNSAAGSNFQYAGQNSPEFTLARIVGSTPYLHAAVDQSYQYGGRLTSQNYQFKQFDVTVELNQAGSSQKTFTYNDCSITNYKVNTRTDNEEGYVTGGKTGFAVVETYSFQCNKFHIETPEYKELASKVDGEKRNKKPYE